MGTMAGWVARGGPGSRGGWEPAFLLDGRHEAEANWSPTKTCVCKDAACWGAFHPHPCRWKPPDCLLSIREVLGNFKRLVVILMPWLFGDSTGNAAGVPGSWTGALLGT